MKKVILNKGYYCSENVDRKSEEFKRWYGMLTRCYAKGGKGLHYYKDVTVCEEWLDFEKFASWMKEQPYAYEEGFVLDKDLTVLGSRVYSPETCCFVPTQVNTILNVRFFNKTQNCPEGVVYKPSLNKYKMWTALTRNDENIEYKDTAEEAFAEYKAFAEDYIKTSSKTWFDKGIISPIIYNNLNNFSIPKKEITEWSKLFRDMLDQSLPCLEGSEQYLPIYADISISRKELLKVRLPNIVETLSKLVPSDSLEPFLKVCKQTREGDLWGNNAITDNFIKNIILTEEDWKYFSKKLKEYNIKNYYTFTLEYDRDIFELGSYKLPDEAVAMDFKNCLKKLVKAGVDCNFSSTGKRFARLKKEFKSTYVGYEEAEGKIKNTFTGEVNQAFSDKAVIKTGRYTGELVNVKGVDKSIRGSYSRNVVVQFHNESLGSENFFLEELDFIRVNSDPTFILRCVEMHSQNRPPQPKLKVGADVEILNKKGEVLGEGLVESITWKIDGYVSVRVLRGDNGKKLYYKESSLREI